MCSLIEIQLDVLLARDSLGRSSTTRDPAPRPAPRVFLGRSSDANVWTVRRDVAPAIRRELERECRREPTLAAPGVDAAPRCVDRARDLLAPIGFEWRGPAYLLPGDLPRDSRARELTAADEPLWGPAFPWLGEHFESFAPVCIAFHDGRPAALCHSPRGHTERAAEAGVETLEAFRGLGLATAAVACWARAVQRSGRLALYSTSWQNSASQRVARRLSARLYGENWHLT